MTLTPEQLAKSKEEFEASVKALPGFIDEILNIHDGRYSYSGTEFMWKGWKLREESLSEELETARRGSKWF